MEDFTAFGFMGSVLGMLLGVAIIFIINKANMPKISGSYLTYENVIYKQVNQEELDNIIVLEVK